MSDKKDPAAEKDEGVTESDLQKSLEKLEEFTTNDDPVARKEALLAKAKEGDLEKAERDELFEILGGSPDATVETEPTTTVGEDLVKSMTDGEGQGTQDALDVSPYLREQNDAMKKSLQSVGDYIEKSDKRQHEHSLMQSKAIVEMGSLVKAMSERLGVIEQQPVRGPKSRGVGADQALAKSFAGGEGGSEGGEDQLSKSDITEALDGVMQESMEGGRNGLTKGGHDVLLEISKFEQTSKLSPEMYREVKGFIGRRNAAH